MPTGSRPIGLCDACYPGNACQWCIQRLDPVAVTLARVWQDSIDDELDNDPLVADARRLVSKFGSQFGKIHFSAEVLRQSDD